MSGAGRVVFGKIIKTQIEKPDGSLRYHLHHLHLHLHLDHYHP
jgi:hypothetical protein